MMSLSDRGGVILFVTKHDKMGKGVDTNVTSH